MKRINTRRSINFIIGTLFFLIFVSLIFSTGKASAEPPPLLIAQLIARIEALEMTVGEQEDLISEYENRIADLEQKLAKVRIDGDIMLFEGVNIQVVNGLGETNTTNGLGNVLVGYNSEGAGIAEKMRDGSHNVIIGDGYEYRSYSELGTTSIVATDVGLNIFSAGKTVVDSQNEFNLNAGGKVNFQAGTDINLNAGGNAAVQTGQAATFVTGKEVNIQAGTGLNLQAQTVDLVTDDDLKFTLGRQAIIKAENDISITSFRDLILKGRTGGQIY